MSCSNKYDKLVQFINTHYNFHANLGQFVLGDRQQYESEAVWRFVCDLKDYIDNLDAGKEDSNVVDFPRIRPTLVSTGNTALYDYDNLTFDSDLDFDTISADFPTGNFYAADTVQFDWGGGNDHITFEVDEEDLSDK